MERKFDPIAAACVLAHRQGLHIGAGNWGIDHDVQRGYVSGTSVCPMGAVIIAHRGERHSNWGRFKDADAAHALGVSEAWIIQFYHAFDQYNESKGGEGPEGTAADVFRFISVLNDLRKGTTLSEALEAFAEAEAKRK